MRRSLVSTLVLLAALGCSKKPETPERVLPGKVSGTLEVYEESRNALTSGGPLQRHDAEAIIEGELLVRFEGPPLTAQEAVARASRSIGSTTHCGFATRHIHCLRTEGSAVLAAERMAPLPGVRYATPNRRVRPRAIPNDRYFEIQWHYRLMNLPAAWDVRTDAVEVPVAVLDTGIRPHRDLDGRILPGVDAISDPAIAGDGDGRDADPLDVGGDLPRGNSSWHGTHVAGTVGAATNNNVGVAGVVWDARIIPVRVLGREGGSSLDIIAGMAWAVGEEIPGVDVVNPNPARVINLSLGSRGGPDPAFQEAVDLVVSTGAVVVVAAGNDGEDTSSSFPCNQTSVICVGATGHSGTRAGYSNYGEAIDVLAPGGDGTRDLDGDGYADAVLSTHFDQEAVPVFGLQQGTSMAAPHVSGLAALMMAENPSLSPADVERALRETASPGFRCPEGCGAGLVNAQAALLAAAGTAPSGPAQLRVPLDAVFIADQRPVHLPLINVGGAPLEVTATFHPRGAAAFLALPAGGSVTVGPAQMAPLHLAAEVTGLAAGDYEGVLRLEPEGGDVQALPVLLRVRERATADEAQVLLVFENAQGDWEIAARTVARGEDDFRYELEVPPGRYFAIAGIDDDGDGILFETGERVGIFPNVDGPEPVEVAPGAQVTDIDFPLIPYTGLDEEDQTLVVGALCASDADCPGGLCDGSVSGGYCTRPCASSRDCPGGSVCYRDVRGTTPVCMATCPNPGIGQSTCRSGLSCREDSAFGGYCDAPLLQLRTD